MCKGVIEKVRRSEVMCFTNPTGESQDQPHGGSRLQAFGCKLFAVIGRSPKTFELDVPTADRCTKHWIINLARISVENRSINIPACTHTPVHIGGLVTWGGLG